MAVNSQPNFLSGLFTSQNVDKRNTESAKPMNFKESMAKAAIAATVAISISFADPMPAMAKFDNEVLNREKPAVEQ